jgi:hypothetical protein
MNCNSHEQQLARTTRQIHNEKHAAVNSQSRVHCNFARNFLSAGAGAGGIVVA